MITCYNLRQAIPNHALWLNSGLLYNVNNALKRKSTYVKNMEDSSNCFSCIHVSYDSIHSEYKVFKFLLQMRDNFFYKQSWNRKNFYFLWSFYPVRRKSTEQFFEQCPQCMVGLVSSLSIGLIHRYLPLSVKIHEQILYSNNSSYHFFKSKGHFFITWTFYSSNLKKNYRYIPFTYIK